MSALFWRRGGACLVVIASGLALRRWALDLGAPFFVWKYGGSALWGTMLYLLAALLPRGPALRIAAVSAVIAVAVEISRLHHTPWLDEFRLTTAGALLLGRHFSPWNIMAYLAGILLGAGVDAFLAGGDDKKALQP